jgi:hypothetical protein
MKELLDIQKIIQNSITEGEKSYHKWYKRTCDFANDYKMFITGEGMNRALKQFIKREDNVLFKQRVDTTQHITSSILKSITDVQKKVPRSNTISRVLGNKNEILLKQLKDKLKYFWKDRSFDDYVNDMFLNLNNIDPNACVSVEWDEDMNVFPFEIYSKNKINYEKNAKGLEWVLCKHITEKGTEKYTFYQAGFNVTYTEVKLKEQGFEYFDYASKIYKIEVISHGLEYIQVSEIGFNLDLFTMETFLSPYDACMPFLWKTVKVNSELDLTMALTAYPQQIRQMNPCDKCFKGIVQETGEKCGTCGGTGLIMPTSVQDVIGVKPPKSGEPEPTLDNIIKYVYPPTEIINLQTTYIETLTEKCKQVVFNSGIFDKKEIAETATGKSIDVDNVNDSLLPQAQKMAHFWESNIFTIAEITNTLTGLDYAFIYSRDFKIKTQSQLLADLEIAKRSGAENFLIETINENIVQMMFLDNQLEYKKYKTKKYFYPYTAMTENEVMFIISSGIAKEYDKVLYSMFGSIFDEIELQYTIAFYDLSRKQQNEIISKLVNEEIEKRKIKEPIYDTTGSRTPAE